MGTWDDLYEAGEKMGFAKGGRVKDTGNQPAKKGTSQQEIEAGGTPKLRPGYKKGGRKKKQKGGEVEVEVVVGNKTTRKSNSGSINKKEMKKGGKTGKKKYRRGGTIKVHGSEPLIGK